MIIDKPDRYAHADDTIEELARRGFYERRIDGALSRDSEDARSAI
jgi:hypothetical protein